MTGASLLLAAALLLLTSCCHLPHPTSALPKGQCLSPEGQARVLASPLRPSPQDVHGPFINPWQDESPKGDGLTCRRGRDQRYPSLMYKPDPAVHRARPLRLRPAPLHLPHCRKLNFSTPLHGGAFTAGSLGPAFNLPTCRLRRLSSDDALRCLAGKRIVWVGDSLTRYQSLSLATWLGNGAYEHPYDQPVVGHPPDVTNEHHWDTWAAYFVAMAKELTEPGCMQSTCVGCYRGANSTRETYEWTYTLKSGTSFRMADSLVQAHPYVDTAALKALDWALKDDLAHKPDLLIFNAGIWVALSCPPDAPLTLILRLYEVIFQRAAALVAAQAPPRTRLVFKATTPVSRRQAGYASHAPRLGMHGSWTQAWPEFEGMVKGLALWYGFDYYDVAAVARAGMAQGLDMLRDDFHFYPFVYAQQNDLLLNILC